MEFFGPAPYHYHHEPMSHYSDPHQAYAMAQAAPVMAMPMGTKANETKPRLGKDEVDVLEREFKKNPKPTTQTKRQFAEEMGVDLARINNWFQNRRAKRKQEKKQEAYEAGQARDALGYSEPSSPDLYNTGSEYYSDNSQVVPVQQASTQFAVVNGPPPPTAPYNPRYSDPSTASMESLQRTMAVAQAASGHDDFRHYVDQHDSMATLAGSMPGFSSSDRAQFPPPDEGIDHYDLNQAFSSYPPIFSDCLFNDHSQPESMAEVIPMPFRTFPNASHELSIPQLMPPFGSNLLPSPAHDGLPLQSGEQFAQGPDSNGESPLPIEFQCEVAEPEESSVAPPGPSIAFKSPPPPMDIASRRKKVQVKPAALVADTMRGRPSMGPRTVSHTEGFRRPADSPAAPAMRRIVSAGANRNVISGRISKSGIESSQRSPINLGGFADAESFLEYNQQNIRNPSMTTGFSLGSSLAPPTPLSPRERDMTFPKMGSNGGCLDFFLTPGISGSSTAVESPPETPHGHMAASSDVFHGIHDLSDRTWQIDVPDEPLFTPAQDSFSMDIHMPQPAYLGTMGQSDTSGFGQLGTNFMMGPESPMFENERARYTLSTPSGSEYSLPDSNQGYMGMLPTATKPKTFQFSHTTAADFSEK